MKELFSILLYFGSIMICFSCKSPNLINVQAVSFQLKQSKSIEPVRQKTLEDIYSGKFYNESEFNGKVDTLTWGYIYRINEEIVLGSNYVDYRAYPDNQETKKTFNYAICVFSNWKNYKLKDDAIQGRIFWLGFYQIPDNKEDYFVDFRSDPANENTIWGRIRFPSSYSLEKIEKETTKILSGIKFPTE